MQVGAKSWQEGSVIIFGGGMSDIRESGVVLDGQSDGVNMPVHAATRTVF